jgi:hypothetical protein
MAVKIISGLGTFRPGPASTTPTNSGPVRVQTSPVPLGPGQVTQATVGHIVGGLQIQPVQPQVIKSARSVDGLANTLFDDHSLVATPVYNFFEEDEARNESWTRAQEKLSEIPRYVHLKWRVPFQRRRAVAVDVTKGNRIPTPKLNMPKSGVGLTFPKLLTVSDVKASSINGFLGAGSVGAKVQISKNPLPSTTVSVDRFLISDSTSGMSANQLASNMELVSFGMTQAAKMAGGRIAGKFSVLKQDGKVSVRGLHASSPSISIDAVAAMRKPTDSGTKRRIYDEVKAPTAGTDATKSTNVRFIDPNITGLVDETKLNLATRPEHVENVITFAQVARGLAGLSSVRDSLGIDPNKIPPSFPASIHEIGTECIGYVIEKYRQTPAGGFILMAEIDIDGPGISEYIDTKVAYGKTYRYRIKSIYRWTHPANVEVKGTVDVGTSGAPGSQTASVSSAKTSYIDSEWDRSWAYAAVVDTMPPAPPDEFTVRPDSRRNRIHLSWKAPWDPQLDQVMVRVLRKESGPSGDLSSWRQIGPFYPFANGSHVDTDVTSSQDGTGYVYALQSISRHGEESYLSEQIFASLVPPEGAGKEREVRQVSCKGVDPDEHAPFDVEPPRRKHIETVARRSVALCARTGPTSLALDDSQYVLRLESLETGETRDITLSVVRQKVPTRVVEQSTSVTVEQETRYPTLFENIRAHAAPTFVGLRPSPAAQVRPGLRLSNIAGLAGLIKP